MDGIGARKKGEGELLETLFTALAALQTVKGAAVKAPKALSRALSCNPHGTGQRLQGRLRALASIRRVVKRRQVIVERFQELQVIVQARQELMANASATEAAGPTLCAQTINGELIVPNE